jgi:hypothetical protein
MEDIAAHIRTIVANKTWVPRVDQLPYYTGPIPELGEAEPSLAH